MTTDAFLLKMRAVVLRLNGGLAKQNTGIGKEGLWTRIASRKKPLMPGMGLLLAMFVFYIYLGFTLARAEVFQDMDILFELDVPRVINDLTNFSEGHHRTYVHPIYVLLVNPLGSFLHLLTGTQTGAAMMINSFLGALGVSLAFTFFYLFGGPLFNSLLLALVFGLSMSQIILFASPETGSLAVVSLLLTYILFLYGLQKKQLPWKWWVFAGVLTLGVTTTNFVQTFIAFSLLSFVLYKENVSFIRLGANIVRYGFWVLGITAGLALIQKVIYPNSSLFFLPAAYAEESGYASLLVLEEPLLVAGQELKQFFLVNFIAPFPDTFAMPERGTVGVTFSSSWNYSAVGYVALALWVGVLIFGMVKSWSYRKLMPFFLGITLCLLFNLLLHSIYGVGEKGKIEYLVYAGNFSFLIMAFLSPFARSSSRWITILLLVLIVLMGVNNLLVYRDILSAYQ